MTDLPHVISDSGAISSASKLQRPVGVAIFASSFHPHLGGVEELVRQLSAGLAGRGLRAIVVTNRWPSDLPVHEVVDEVAVYRFPFRAPDVSWRSWVAHSLTHRLIERHVTDLMAEQQIDVIHVQCVSTNGHYASVAAERLNLPLVMTSQGERTMDADRIYERSAFLNHVLRDLLAGANAVTACSRDTLSDLERYAGQPLGDRGSVIWNGISLEEFADPAIMPLERQRPYILGIGRWVTQKGFDVLIEAFASAATDPAFDHDLVLAGEGPERTKLEQLVRTCGIEDRVTLHGRADRPTAVSLFQGCSFFVLPSRHEPFGIVNLEAMAAGKAVVATRVGGVPEFVVHGENGILVEPDRVGELATQLRCLADDESLRTRLGRHASETAKRFCWDRITDQYINVYEDVMADRHE